MGAQAKVRPERSPVLQRIILHGSTGVDKGCGQSVFTRHDFDGAEAQEHSFVLLCGKACAEGEANGSGQGKLTLRLPLSNAARALQPCRASVDSSMAAGSVPMPVFSNEHSSISVTPYDSRTTPLMVSRSPTSWSARGFQE